MSNAIKNAMAKRGIRFETLLVFYGVTGVLSILLAAMAVCVHSAALLGIACALGLAFMFGTLVLVMLDTGSISIRPETAFPPRPRRSGTKTFSIQIDNDLAEEVWNSCTDQELEKAAASLRSASDRLAKAAERVESRVKGRTE